MCVAFASVARYLEEVSRFLVSETAEEPSVTRENVDAPTWLNDVYSYVAQGRVDPAVDLLFQHVDDLLSAGQFARCDDLIRTIDLKRFDTNLLVGVLSVTLGAADKLSARASLVEKVAVRLGELAPSRVDRLLSGIS